MSYEEALAYLDALLTQRLPSPEPYSPVKLERMRRLCALLDHPERAFPAVLVAGTKGKGSTAAMIAAMTQAAGFRVGLYTKPHLEDFRERIRVDGAMIPPADLIPLVEQVRDAIARGAGGPGWPPTYFDAAAALAFLHFADRKVDLAVVEVGIGGRLDATNVVDARASVITTIGYDHTELLGTRLEAIAAEDAGTIRRGGHVVSAPQLPTAARVLKAAAEAQQAELIRVGHEVRYRTLKASLAGVHLTVWGQRGSYRDLWVPLLGRHQALNAAAAVGAVEALREVGFETSDAAMRDGLARLQWPARIEILGCCPMVVIDVAHNVVSFQALRAVLDEVFIGRRVVLVLGALGSKDLGGIARLIGSRAAAVVATRAHDPRATSAEAVAETFAPWCPDVRAVEDPIVAAEEAIEMAGHEDLVCVTGSFHVAGPVRSHLMAKPGCRGGWRPGLSHEGQVAVSRATAA